MLEVECLILDADSIICIISISLPNMKEIYNSILIIIKMSQIFYVHCSCKTQIILHANPSMP